MGQASLGHKDDEPYQQRESLTRFQNISNSRQGIRSVDKRTPIMKKKEWIVVEDGGIDVVENEEVRAC